MIAIQRQFLSSNNHVWHNKIYNIPIVAVNVKAPILLNKLDANRHECEHDEKSKTYTQDNKEVEICNRKRINHTLLNGNTSFIFIFSGQDKHLRRIIPDKLIMIVSSRNVTSRYLKRFIRASTAPNSCPSISNTLAINTAVNSKTDISNLPSESVETMQYLFDELLKPQFLKAQLFSASKPKNRIKLHTNLKRYEIVTSLISEQNKVVKTIPKKSARVKIARTPVKSLQLISPNSYTSRFFKTYFVEGRRMSIKVPTYRYNSFSIASFMKLVSLYNDAKLAVNVNIVKNVLSTYQRDWHVRDLFQGFLLTVLLKHYDMASLYVTRKPYFVIITGNTINKSVLLNFKLSNGIPKAYDIKLFENSSFDFTQWNDEHAYILNTSSYNFCVFKFDKTYASTESDDLECKINTSYYGSASSIKIDSSDERINNEYTKNASRFTETENSDFESRNSSDTYTKESSYTMLSYDDVTDNTQINLNKCSGNTDFSKTRKKPSYLHNAILRLAKSFFRKVFDETTALKVLLGIPYFNSDRIINESIFESTVISAFTFKISQFWIQHTQQICYSVFLKCLGLNSICNMCSI